MITRRALSSLRHVPLARGLSSRASAVLSALDIRAEAELPGVYDGEWAGSGDLLKSVCPTTGEVLARVKSVSGLYARSQVGHGTQSHVGFASGSGAGSREVKGGIQGRSECSCTQTG